MPEPAPTKSGTKELCGLPFPIGFSDDAVMGVLSYEPREDDLFIVTYPKCGTTWCQQIVSLILNGGRPYGSYKEFVLLTPFLEKLGIESGEQMPRPGLMKMHLPFAMTPYNPKAKYICVVRNPKDVVVSYYHHAVSTPLYRFANGEFGTYFDEFLNGEVAYGDYFSHVNGWYEHKDDPNVLLFTYEEMKVDTEAQVMKIAEFMGQEWSEMFRNDRGMMDNVLKYSSVAEMRDLFNRDAPDPETEAKLMSYPGYVYTKDYVQKYFTGTKLNLVRKGIVGDWRQVFTEDQNERMDAKIEDSLKETALYDIWKNLGCI